MSTDMLRRLTNCHFIVIIIRPDLHIHLLHSSVLCVDRTAAPGLEFHTQCDASMMSNQLYLILSLRRKISELAGNSPWPRWVPVCMRCTC